MEELADSPELHEDASLIRQQADRCRDILRSMGRAGKEDHHLKRAPLETVIEEAAEPHMGRGKAMTFDLVPGVDQAARQPVVLRRPEVIHGLRNLIQNAVDFAKSEVRIEMSWTEESIVVRIVDDGAGFPQQLIGRIGDPFVRRRRADDDRARRPGYEGMGLGLFIAKTLLERSGARLSFANGGEHGGGAIVQVEWPRDMLDAAAASEAEDALGENRLIRV